ncbi:MAG: alanine--tRNA ligase [Candidatus Cryptobacteroides sp.]|nr:alanine--tRNA ligase [Bacteroidales bacterium]MDY2773182.1 alanine--tRNA ligase [Candidatus Cryptobacteroides sp.]
MMTSKEIRKAYLDFFASKGHTIVPSAPMVVKNDPTLMFTNAGMNQFKDWLLGNSPAPFPRATDSQKCLRVSGKHNDLEEVGHDTYHHTMFEMLGNWSFGDYFKNEAIDWAWELLTEVYKIDTDRLYATVFEGSVEDGTSLDTEARDRWLSHLPADRVLLGNKHDNFWEMGDTGPCGPCSEIHVDLRSDEERKAVPGAELVNKGHHLVIEIWNLVFMQYNRKADGSLELLPHRNVDTGMGFERLCMTLQGKQSNYDTDVFTGMIHKIEELSGKEYGKDENVDIAMRVIADHIRAIAFSIADGQLPSNVKAGYVIRRILRRAVRYGYTFLGFGEPFLCRLVGQLVSDMGEFYPEIALQQTLIEKVIREEEMAFLRTLDRGIKLIDSIMEKCADTKVIKGEDAFTLYDTFGFPIDLSELIASEKGYTIDLEGFETELKKQKDRARNATANEFGDWIEFHHCDNVEFLGYDFTEIDGARLTRHRTVKQKNKEMIQLVFDRTPFYGEMGGQVGDTGYIESEDGERIKILDTVKENNLTIHIAEKLPSDCSGSFRLVVDAARRRNIESNHSCTHLLHQALREILGTHVEQKGSFVTPDYFRFDFSHFEKLTDEQIDKVEKRVNELIRTNFPLVEKRDGTMDDAKAMGAMALFGEKYGDHVRIVRFGDSVELCGGCHTSATGNIGFFKIVSESAIAAGIRRIEARTGLAAENIVDMMENTLRSAKALFNNAPDLALAIKKLIDENDGFKKEIENVAKEKAAAFKQVLLDEAKEINGIRTVVLRQADPARLKNAAFILQKEAENLAVVAAYETEGKPQLLVMYSADLVAKGHNASNDVRAAAKAILGGGGGQPGLATAGGKNVQGLDDAIEILLSNIK